MSDYEKMKAEIVDLIKMYVEDSHANGCSSPRPGCGCDREEAEYLAAVERFEQAVRDDARLALIGEQAAEGWDYAHGLADGATHGFFSSPTQEPATVFAVRMWVRVRVTDALGMVERVAPNGSWVLVGFHGGGSNIYYPHELVLASDAEAQERGY